jgi:hypothetical protein
MPEYMKNNDYHAGGYTEIVKASNARKDGEV